MANKGGTARAVKPDQCWVPLGGVSEELLAGLKVEPFLSAKSEGQDRSAVLAALRRDIRIDLTGPAGLTLEADRTEIEMIFNNLISNAVKYNRDHGRVTVSTNVSGDEIKIQVQDTGIGMTQEECQRLFVDFSRRKNEKTRHILGSGLGLSTLKKLVTLYDGEITARSQPEVGSTLVVLLRRNPKASEQNTQAESRTGSIVRRP